MKAGGIRLKQRVAIMVGCLCGGGMERVAAQLSVMLSNFGFEVYILVHAFDKRNVYEYKGYNENNLIYSKPNKTNTKGTQSIKSPKNIV